MFNIKKIFCGSMVASILLAGSNLFANNETELEKAYMLGAFHSLEQLSRNFKVQGINKAKVNLNKYIVALDISTLPTYKLLIYQQIGYTESLTPIIVNDKYLVFNSYERKADALYLQEKVLNSFHFKTKDEKTIVIENDNPNGWYKSQFVQKELFDTLAEEINKNVKAKVFVVKDDNGVLDNKLDALENMNKKENLPVKEAIVQSPIPTKKEVIKPVEINNKVKQKDEAKVTKFKLKSLVSFYTYQGKNDKTLLSKHLIPSKDAKTLRSEKYVFATTKKADDGTVWVKLYDSNLWVEQNEIEIID